MTSKKMRKCKFWIALPDATLSETSHLRDKTVKTGLIGRICAVFGVQRLYIYQDHGAVNSNDLRVMKTLLEYMELPQYLRKRVYGRSMDLAYAGLLPPLRTPHHKLNVELSNIQVGEYREGISIRAKDSLYVDCGLVNLIPLEGAVQENTRVTIRFTSPYPNLKCRIVEKTELKEYWGYIVKEASSLVNLFKEVRPDLLIFTSKKGEPLQRVWNLLVQDMRHAESIMLVFGSPRRGIFEILRDELKTPQSFSQYILNTIPDQATETVRTEEALLTTLSLMNLAYHL